MPMFFFSFCPQPMDCVVFLMVEFQPSVIWLPTALLITPPLGVVSSAFLCVAHCVSVSFPPAFLHGHAAATGVRTPTPASRPPSCPRTCCKGASARQPRRPPGLQGKIESHRKLRWIASALTCNSLTLSHPGNPTVTVETRFRACGRRGCL